ncbi:RICIN domain-containing protein [Streptomyces kaniharaensis]|uniref:RICIN domain-containing protein n=1 Tax=Streptomyces kaniharaensis TaxID=212423 RepID=A0A6N7KZ11_9ACTN|nr:RICIN domain-containing protein [Streptomyces kaniharaensis]MQS15498.1 RICIN domain-containing protein [Streptomyces kaniharaensis]
MTIHSTVKRRLGSSAAVLALGLGAGLLAAVPASASGFVPLSADSAVEIRAAFSGKCLEVADSRTDDGAPVRQAACTGDDNQQWQVRNGYVVNVNSGKCMEVPGWSTAAGTAIGQWTCNGGDNQRWGRVNVNGDTLAVVNFRSGLLLDVAGANANDGTPVIQWYADNHTNQRWSLNPTD